MANNNDRKLRDIEMSDTVMMRLWMGIIAAGVLLIAILVIKVFTYKEDRFHPFLVPRKELAPVIPVRGDILDTKGRIIATSAIIYEVRLDCKAACDTLWNNNIAATASGLASILKDRTAAEYEQYLRSARKAGNRYLLISREVSQSRIIKLRQLPILREAPHVGGYIESGSQKRQYPYGTSARRTIGYVKDNADSTGKGKKGIEGAFDKYLHGTDGVQLKTKSDFGMIPVSSRNNRRCIDGSDIRTTIDIDIQNIADKALRECVEKSDKIEKACVIVLDTKTAAVRAMVNLGRNSKGQIGEWDNYAIRTAEAPGSIFKTVLVAALLEEGYLKTMDKTVPTYGGIWRYNGISYNDCKHVGKDKYPSGKIPVREAFAMSANNPFRQLLCDGDFGKNPSRFIQKIKGFGLFDTLKFDIPGATPPFILDPSMKKPGPKGFWDGGTLPRMAIGYGMELSPLNLVTFYNAIACDGRMMKPYLIEWIGSNGRTEQSFDPEVLHDSIFSKATADTLERVMGRVTTEKKGTAYWQLKDAVCTIAGKTGTAQRVFRMSNGKWGYHDYANDYESQQGSFVGFFPKDNPEYTAITVVWCRPAARNFYGATYAAPVIREIADKIYCLRDGKNGLE